MIYLFNALQNKIGNQAQWYKANSYNLGAVRLSRPAMEPVHEPQEKSRKQTTNVG